jgi:hypothetical protein
MVDKIIDPDLKGKITMKQPSKTKHWLKDTPFEELLIESLSIIRNKPSQEIWDSKLKFDFYKIFY